MTRVFKLGLVVTAVLVALVLIAWPGSGHAQNVRTRTFPLNTVVKSSAVLCVTRKDAIDLVLEGTLKDRAALEQLLDQKTRDGTCQERRTALVYTERVVRFLEKDRVSLSVYEAVLHHETVYMVVEGWVDMMPGSI